MAKTITELTTAGAATLSTDLLWVEQGGLPFKMTLLALQTAMGITAEVNDLSDVVTWDNVPDGFITESSVTQHEAALTILESQITNANVLVRIASDETITGAHEHHNASFGTFAIDRLSDTGGAAIQYRNNDGIKGYIGVNDNEELQFYDSASAATGFTVSSTGVVAANTIDLGDNDEVQFGNLAGGDAQIYWDASRFKLDTEAANTYHSIDTPGTDTRLYLEQAGADAAWIRVATNFEIRSLVHGATFALYGENDSGVNTTMFLGDPEGLAQIYHIGVSALRTQLETATDVLGSAESRDAHGTFRDIGFQTMEEDTFTANRVVDKEDWSQQALTHTNATTHTLTFNTLTTVPNGAVMWVKARTGIVTLVDGTMVLTLYAGAGLSTGNISVAIGGWATIHKTGDSAADVTGVGLT